MTEAQFQKIEAITLIGVKEALTVKEASILLSISEDRLRHLMCEKLIPYYKNGGKVYLSKKELTEWQLKDRIPTNEELTMKAKTRLLLKRIK